MDCISNAESLEIFAIIPTCLFNGHGMHDIRTDRSSHFSKFKNTRGKTHLYLTYIL